MLSDAGSTPAISTKKKRQISTEICRFFLDSVPQNACDAAFAAKNSKVSIVSGGRTKKKYITSYVTFA